MEIKMTEKQFRRLLDLVYIGNWVLNSTVADDFGLDGGTAVQMPDAEVE